MDAAVSTVVLGLTLLMISTNQGSKLTMISRSKDLIVDIQDTVAFECSFHFQAVAYNLFEYPLIWRKTQGHEDIQINMMSNVNEPFAATNRFQVSFDTDHPNYTLKLTIKEIRHEDSGNYTCEVRGPSSNVLGKVVYYLFVREAINRIILTDNIMLDNFDQDNSASSDVINLVENRQSTLRCISIGGSPPPKIDIYVGEEKITHDVNFRRNFTLLGNERGLKIMKHYSEKSIVKYRPTSDDGGKEFKCVATVPSFKQYVHAVKISVDYAPKISCIDTHSYLGEKNVNIKCEIRSKPAIKSLRWIIDSNQTELTEGKVVNEFWTLVNELQSNLLETRLFIRQAKENVFQNYTLMVDNAIASTTKNVTLYKKHTRRIGSTKDRQPTRVEITDASHETNEQMLYKSGQDKLPYICTFYSFYLGLNTNIFLYFIVHYL